MGFQRRTYKLVFDGVYEGLEVRTRGASIGEYVETRAVTALGAALFDQEHETDRNRLLEILAGADGALVGWNLTDDTDVPVPCTADQLAKEDLWMLLAITRAWLEAGSGADAPLSRGSGGGVPPEITSLPMEAL